MGKFKRPTNKTELEDLEAQGLWRAIALSKRVGEGNEKITLEVIQNIHKVMLKDAMPEAAGRFRVDGEDVKKLKCHEPPPGRLVKERMYVFWRELDTRLAKIPRHPKKQSKTQRHNWYASVIDVAAWIQHQLSHIHPFCDGNGRMARLMTNLILSRFALPPSRVKYEGNNRTEYIQALCQIDLYGDYEPLKRLIAKSIAEAYKKEQEIRLRNRKR
jgi:Fic family protein